MASSVQRYFAGLSRNTFLLAAASLFADISTEMLYHVLTVFLTQMLKASGSQPIRSDQDEGRHQKVSDERPYRTH